MHILVVEDETHLRQSLVRNLEDEGYSVTAAEDGVEGLFFARNETFDLIILDVMLPQLNGWQLLDEIRAKGIKTPVLMLTARDSVQDRVKGLDTGADDYLTKPFDVNELFARMRSLLRRTHGFSDECLQLGAVNIYPTSKSVTLNGEAIKLTPREYFILEVLALRRGRVISASMLLDSLEAQGKEMAESSVEVHVHNLRRKLGKNLIQTVRGHGYKIT